MNRKIKKLIESEPVAVATVMKGSQPNVIGVACVKVVEGKVLITDNFMKQTIEDIKNNPSVALIVWNKKWEGYKLIGKAKYFNQGRWLEKVKAIPENKGQLAKGAVVVAVSKIIKSA